MKIEIHNKRHRKNKLSVPLCLCVQKKLPPQSYKAIAVRRAWAF